MFKFFYLSAQEDFISEGNSFDFDSYKLVKTSRDKILLIGRENYIDVFQNKTIPYKNSLDSLFLEINFNNLNYVSLDEKIYLIKGGGGYVLEFDYQSLKRIDNSSNLRAYFAAKNFSHKKGLYQFGGYGFFKFNSQILKFDFNLKEWFLTDLILENDFGFVDPIISTYQNKLFIFSRKVADNFFGNKINNPFVYVYDFDSKEIDKIRFDFQKFDFLFGSNDFSFWNRYSSKGLIYIANYSNPREIYRFDVLNNNYQKYNLSAPINSRSDIEILGDDLYYLAPIPSTNKLYLAKNSILNNIDMGSIRSAVNLIYFIAALLFCISFYLFRVKRVFRLQGKDLKRGFKKVRLDYDQVYFLTKLCKEKSINNTDLISYFDRDSKSYDLNVKRKNSMVSSLEFKIHSVFKTNLFEKVPSPKDKRQGIYILKKKLTLADKKS